MSNSKNNIILAKFHLLRKCSYSTPNGYYTFKIKRILLCQLNHLSH